MANNFVSYAEASLPKFLEKLERESVSNIFKSNRFSFVGKKTVRLYTGSTSGFGDYDRATGYPTGSISGDWIELTLSQDRAVKFTIDEMDNDEEMNMVLTNQMGSFANKQGAPNIDAYCFSKIAGTTNVKVDSGDVVYGTTNVADLVDAGNLYVNKKDGNKNRVLILNDECYAALEKNCIRTIANGDTSINSTILTYHGLQVLPISETRFYDAITQYDGRTSGQTNGGFIPAAGAHKINFMIVPLDAVDKIVKIDRYKVLGGSDQDTQFDAYTVKFRTYYDLFVNPVLADTIYVHKAATAHDANNN